MEEFGTQCPWEKDREHRGSWQGVFAGKGTMVTVACCFAGAAIC
jgi:hypothetical protein